MRIRTFWSLELVYCSLAWVPDAFADTNTTTTSSASAALEAELAAALSALPSPAPASTPAPPAASGNASSRGLSTAFNPAISANGIFYLGLKQGETPAENPAGDLVSGIHLQEVELQASAVVDPYFRADIVLTADESGVGVEEAYLTTLEIPHLTVRAGQLHAGFGKHNLLHTHAYPFLTAPLPWRALLGPEGLSDPGVSLDVLLPLPFFAELNAQVFRGTWAPLVGTTPKNDRDLAYLGHLKTLFELSDSSTIELGGSYAGGQNGYGGFTSIVGADLTVKWRPLEHERDFGLDWTTEYLYVARPQAPEDAEVGGAYTSLRWQLDTRWWLQGRAALLGIPAPAAGRTWRGEALLAFVPSEFSLLRLQYAYQAAEHQKPAGHEVFLQAVFSIGSHPAHAY
ncbi:MAG: hypothetical protein U1E65_21340 [Myxococcota bacterium]